MQHSCSLTAILPLPLTFHYPSMAATTSTPRRYFETFHRANHGSNGHHDFSEANVGIPFHGSCSRCHHFHVNHLFTFSLDSTVHTRLFCQRCNHPMFGLGRISTQNTLASVESGSIFTPRACVDRPGQLPALQVEAVPGTSGLGLLTTITERRTPAPSRSTSNIPTPAPTPAAASLAGEEAGADIRQENPVESRVLPKGTAHGNSEERALHPQIATFRRLQTIGRRFKQRLSPKPRQWKLPRIGLQITYAPRVGMAGDASASAFTTEVSSGQEQLDNAEELVHGTGDDTEDRHATLRARRRESTLAREGEVALIPKCECSPECPCSSGSRVVQMGRAETPENIFVPDYLFPHHHSSTGSSNSQSSQNGAQGLDLLHIGGHFDSPRRSSSADESSSAAESGPRRIRLSQGSTLWSNGSSASLRGRQSLVGRASSMPVGTRAQYLAGVRTGSRTNSSIPGSGWLETPRAPSSLEEGSIPGRTSHTGSSRNGEFPSHESSSSLSNLLDPQGEEQLINGMSPTSHTPIRNGDECTLTPHSGIHLDTDLGGMLPMGSDRLSSALQDLANREIPDHEVHSPESLANVR